MPANSNMLETFSSLRDDWIREPKGERKLLVWKRASNAILDGTKYGKFENRPPRSRVA
jgi:hypothetical protein